MPVETSSTEGRQCAEFRFRGRSRRTPAALASRHIMHRKPQSSRAGQHDAGRSLSSSCRAVLPARSTDDRVCGSAGNVCSTNSSLRSIGVARDENTFHQQHQGDIQRFQQGSIGKTDSCPANPVSAPMQAATPTSAMPSVREFSVAIAVCIRWVTLVILGVSCMILRGVAVAAAFVCDFLASCGASAIQALRPQVQNRFLAKLLAPAAHPRCCERCATQSNADGSTKPVVSQQPMVAASSSSSQVPSEFGSVSATCNTPSTCSSPRMGSDCSAITASENHLEQEIQALQAKLAASELARLCLEQRLASCETSR